MAKMSDLLRALADDLDRQDRKNPDSAPFVEAEVWFDGDEAACRVVWEGNGMQGEITGDNDLWVVWDLTDFLTPR